MLRGPSIHKCGTAIQMQLSIRHTFKNKQTPTSKYKVHKSFEVYLYFANMCRNKLNSLQLHTFENAISIDRWAS